MTDASSSFSSEVALAVVTRACSQLGLPADGVRLLRFGENAIYGLSHAPVVVRVARSPDRLAVMEKELCIARWLAAGGVPTVQPYDALVHPVLVQGYPVSFWQALREDEPRPGFVDLAGLIARFHALPEPDCDLPVFDPLHLVQPRIDAAQQVGDEDRAFLSRLCAELEESYRGLWFVLPAGPIHGDAHPGNLLRDGDRVVLLDYEAVARGPREWDLIPAAISCARFGLPEAEFRAFSKAYGFDVREWSGYRILREIRELTMTTWLMQNVRESPRVAAEFQLRVRSLREGDMACAWHAF